MDNFNLILKIVWAVLGWLFKGKESKDKEVAQVQKEITDAFKIKDKKEKASRINSIICDINNM